jgi:hypothetical protein
MYLGDFHFLANIDPRSLKIRTKYTSIYIVFLCLARMLKKNKETENVLLTYKTSNLKLGNVVWFNHEPVSGNIFHQNLKPRKTSIFFLILRNMLLV